MGRVMDPKFPFSLLRLVFQKTLVESLEHKRPGQAGSMENFPIEMDMSIDQNPEDPTQHAVILTLVGNRNSDQAFPYHIEVKCAAVFRRDVEPSDELPAERLRMLLAQVGHNVCVGASRELIASVTGRHDFGPLLMGLVHLQFTKGPTQPVDLKNQPPANTSATTPKP